jgi:cytidylate kinase
MIVTVDGPGGTGKSTVSRVVARRAGLPHLDTGAYYRAATLAVLRTGADPHDPFGVFDVVSDVTMSQEDDRMYLDGHDVSDEIRGEAVTAAVSAVSAHPEVRGLLVEKQRAWAYEHGGGVVEGRDIGSVVFPEAEVKVFLDASPEVRARRRAAETGESYEGVYEDLNRRDSLDSMRASSPLTVPEGAVVVDTSELTFDEVVDKLLELISANS